MAYVNKGSYLRRSTRQIQKSPKYKEDERASLPMSPDYEPSPPPAQKYQVNSPDYIPERVMIERMSFEKTNAYIDHMLLEVEDNLS